MFTFGKLINDVVSVELTLCNDLNLKNQLNKQKMLGKKELGKFSHQFKTSPFPTPL